MTDLTITPIDELLDLDLGDEHPHLECCRVERFFCGKPFHPELSAPGLNAPFDEVCTDCSRIMAENWCHRGHQHCPIPLMQGFVCPDA